MASVFPGALDTYTNPASGDPRTNLAAKMSLAQDSLANIEALLGITNSAVTNSIDYLSRRQGSAAYIITNIAGTYEAYDVANDAMLATTSTNNVGLVINACSDALTNGGTIFLRDTGQVYANRTKISLGSGVRLVSTATMEQDAAQGPVIQASIAMTDVVELTGNNAAVHGVFIDGNSLARVGIHSKAAGCVWWDTNVVGCTLFNYWIDGTAGAMRCVGKSFRTQAIQPLLAAAPSASRNLDSTAGQIDAGTHYYALAQVTAKGEQTIGLASGVVTNNSTHTSTSVTIPALAGVVTGYKLYRTKAGASNSILNWFLVADVTASAGGTYNDIKTDASLGVAPFIGAGVLIDGPDHIIANWRVAGAGQNAFAARFSGQHTVAVNSHVTASDNSAGIVLVDNAAAVCMSNAMLDTGVDNSNGSASLLIASGGNQFDNILFYNNKGAATSCIEIRKVGSGDFRQRNIFSNIQVDGNNGGGGGSSVSFAYLLSVMDETGAVPTSLARWAGTIVEAAELVDVATGIVNYDPASVSFPSAIRLQDVRKVAASTSAPIVWASNNYGSAVFSGTGSQTAFTIPHLMGFTPVRVSVQAGSSAAKGDFYVTVDATNITVTYATAPASGSNNVTLFWDANL